MSKKKKVALRSLAKMKPTTKEKGNAEGTPSKSSVDTEGSTDSPSEESGSSRGVISRKHGFSATPSNHPTSDSDSEGDDSEESRWSAKRLKTKPSSALPTKRSSLGSLKKIQKEAAKGQKQVSQKKKKSGETEVSRGAAASVAEKSLAKEGRKRKKEETEKAGSSVSFFLVFYVLVLTGLF